jgi:hypothetical protein
VRKSKLAYAESSHGKAHGSVWPPQPTKVPADNQHHSPKVNGKLFISVSFTIAKTQE